MFTAVKDFATSDDDTLWRAFQHLQGKVQQVAEGWPQLLPAAALFTKQNQLLCILMLEVGYWFLTNQVLQWFLPQNNFY